MDSLLALSFNAALARGKNGFSPIQLTTACRTTPYSQFCRQEMKLQGNNDSSDCRRQRGSTPAAAERARGACRGDLGVLRWSGCACGICGASISSSTDGYPDARMDGLAATKQILVF